MIRVSYRRSVRQVVRWFDPRQRDSGSWAFILHRLSGIGLTVYLGMHLLVLSTLARGPAAYDSFVALAKSPLFLLGELLLIAGGLYHGLNGLRVSLTSFGFGLAYQRQLFYAVLAGTALISAIFAIRMFA